MGGRHDGGRAAGLVLPDEDGELRRPPPPLATDVGGCRSIIHVGETPAGELASLHPTLLLPLVLVVVVAASGLFFHFAARSKTPFGLVLARLQGLFVSSGAAPTLARCGKQLDMTVIHSSLSTRSPPLKILRLQS